MCEFKHVCFVTFGQTCFFKPTDVNVGMTSRTGTGPSAFCYDPVDTIRHGTFHDGMPLSHIVNERLKLTRFQRLNLTHPLWRKAPRRAALI